MVQPQRNPETGESVYPYFDGEGNPVSSTGEILREEDSADQTDLHRRLEAFADLSKLKGQALKDAEWVLGFAPGMEWVTGAFRPNREAELVRANVLVPTDQTGVFTVATEGSGGLRWAR